MAYQEKDWVHRVLQFIFGAVVGAGIGFFAWREFPDFPAWLVLGGGALIVGTLAAIFGDDLWHGMFNTRS